MASGLLALLDDVSALVKVSAAASLLFKQAACLCKQ